MGLYVEETQSSSFIPRHLSSTCAEYIRYFTSHEIKSWKSFTTSDKQKLKGKSDILYTAVTHITDHSPELPHAVRCSPILKSLCKNTLFLPRVKKDKILPSTTHSVHLSMFQNLHWPNCWQVHRHTWRLADCDVLLYKTNQIQITAIKSKLRGVENPISKVPFTFKIFIRVLIHSLHKKASSLSVTIPILSCQY